eukprot:6777686-Pyramimonas_sp.AAC.1
MKSRLSGQLAWSQLAADAAEGLPGGPSGTECHEAGGGKGGADGAVSFELLSVCISVVKRPARPLRS